MPKGVLSCLPSSAKCCRRRARRTLCCVRMCSRIAWCSTQKVSGTSRPICLNRYNAQHQRLWRQFVSEVELLTLDGNGRFLLPKRYLQMASIQQSIRFIGNGDTIEIWASEKVEAAKLSKEEFVTLINILKKSSLLKVQPNKRGKNKSKRK